MKHLKLFEEHKTYTIKDFIAERGYKPKTKKYPYFIYHATNKDLDKFYLDPNLDYEEIDGNGVWDIDMPSGYLFLTNNIIEAKAYGRYVIPFELNTKDIFTIKVDSNSPSIAFDDDYNYGSKYNMWQKFQNTTDMCLEVRGYNNLSTFICYISDELIPRIDIAKEFYKV
jgi:hypothetical protein